MVEPMLNELRQEAETTKRLLDRVPANKLDWRPHPKSMPLGQLALHVASIPGDLTRLAQRRRQRQLSNRRCPNRKQWS